LSMDYSDSPIPSQLGFPINMVDANTNDIVVNADENFTDDAEEVDEDVDEVVDKAIAD
ncbi:hypothetical protein KI387_037146, partial [Taxus chinensis]